MVSMSNVAIVAMDLVVRSNIFLAPNGPSFREKRGLLVDGAPSSMHDFCFASASV